MIPELAALQTEMKRLLKSKGLSYQNIAEKLEVSVITVKRALNNDDASFSRLIEICDILGVSFYDLVALSRQHQKRTYSLSLEQENVLCRGKNYFLVFRQVLMGIEGHQIQKNLNLDIKDFTQILSELEKCALLERHPEDRIKLLAKFPFKWHLKGPLERTYGPQILKKIESETLNVGLNQQNESSMNHVFEWALSEETQKCFYRELTELFEKYRSYAQIEINNQKEGFIPTTGLISVGRYGLWD